MSFLDSTTYSPTDDTVNFSAERLASIAVNRCRDWGEINFFIS